MFWPTSASRGLGYRGMCSMSNVYLVCAGEKFRVMHASNMRTQRNKPLEWIFLSFVK